jgi:hypothetical protein
MGAVYNNLELLLHWLYVISTVCRVLYILYIYNVHGGWLSNHIPFWTDLIRTTHVRHVHACIHVPSDLSKHVYICICISAKTFIRAHAYLSFTELVEGKIHRKSLIWGKSMVSRQVSNQFIDSLLVRTSIRWCWHPTPGFPGFPAPHVGGVNFVARNVPWVSRRLQL